MKDICNPALTLTPPMGWNSWDCFGLDVTEDEVRDNADYMAAHLKEYGWEYVVIDLGWYAPGVSTSNYKKPEIPLNIDQYGRLVPVEERFPSSKDGNGFKPLSDYIHSLGLKFGIHIMRGMPWISAAESRPIKGSNKTCADIVDKRNCCLWYNSMYGIDCTKEGAYAYYDSLIELYTEWGVDFIKADDMGSWDGDGLNSPIRTDEIEALSLAIRNHGNRIVLSISPGAANVDNAVFLGNHAHMWRISCDFWDNWEALLRQFPRCATWAERRQPGRWPDADMLPLGKIGIRGEVGSERSTNFTPDEQKSLFSLWCMFRSPLMFGGDLTQMDDFTLSLLSNREILEICLYSAENKQVFSDDSLVIWKAENYQRGLHYTAIFNIGNEVKAAECISKVPRGTYWDLWDKAIIKPDEPILVNPHGVRLLSSSPEDGRSHQK